MKINDINLTESAMRSHGTIKNLLRRANNIDFRTSVRNSIIKKIGRDITEMKLRDALGGVEVYGRCDGGTYSVTLDLSAYDKMLTRQRAVAADGDLVNIDLSDCVRKNWVQAT